MSSSSVISLDLPIRESHFILPRGEDDDASPPSDEPDTDMDGSSDGILTPSSDQNTDNESNSTSSEGILNTGADEHTDSASDSSGEVILTPSSTISDSSSSRSNSHRYQSQSLLEEDRVQDQPEDIIEREYPSPQGRSRTRKCPNQHHCLWRVQSCPAIREHMEKYTIIDGAGVLYQERHRHFLSLPRRYIFWRILVSAVGIVLVSCHGLR